VRRGEVWTIPTVGRERTVLLVGNDDVTAISNSAQGVPIDTAGTLPETLVTVRLATPVTGIARVADVGPFRKVLFGEASAQRHGTVEPAVMERVEIALRAVFDL
jgi:mRNA-degrading endonuclease toxin of MazEF toxin-antitoxin module